MLRRKLRKTTTMIMAIVMTLGVSATGIWRDSVQALDPFAEMEDHYILQNMMPSSARLQRERLMEGIAGGVDSFSRSDANKIRPMEPHPDMMKTDRFLVTYNSG